MSNKWIPGGRKFFFALSVLLLSTVCLACGLLDASAYVTLTLGTVGAYIGGNVAQDYRPPRTGTRDTEEARP